MKGKIKLNLILGTLWIIMLFSMPKEVNAAESDFVIEKQTLVSYQGTASDVIIPDTVTVIGQEAFKGKAGVSFVGLNEKVTRIEKKAFAGCTGLTDIVIPNSVTYIAEDAFEGCTYDLYFLTHKGSYGEKYAKDHKICYVDYARQPDGRYFSSSVGMRYRMDKGFIIEDKGLKYQVTKSKSFTKCEVACIGAAKTVGKKLTIPKQIRFRDVTYKVTSIGKSAFRGEKKLENIDLGKNVKKISQNAFNGCKKLRKLTIQSKVLKTVAKGAWKGVHKKVKVKAPSKKYAARYRKLLKKSGLRVA